MKDTPSCRADRSTRVGPWRSAVLVPAVALLLATMHAGPSRAADAAHGAQVYQDCMLCHSLDRNEIGPRHRDVFGREAASVPDYAYSAALKASGIVWNETTLDRWLADPPSMVPGTKMTFSVDDAQDRADVIAFLKGQAADGSPSTTLREK